MIKIILSLGAGIIIGILGLTVAALLDEEMHRYH